jgi:integrase
MKRTPIPEARAQVLLRRVAELYAQNLENQPEPKRWLGDHGLADQRLWAAHRLGASNGTLKGVLPGDNGILTELTAVGVFDSEGHETFADCIVCPICAEPGGIQTLVGWPMTPAGPMRHLANRPGGLWNANVLTTANEVYLATSVLDGLSIASCGITNVVATVGSQAESLHKKLSEHGVRRVSLVAGDTADAQTKAQRMRAVGVGLITLPAAASVNQFLVARGSSELARVLTTAPPAGGALDGAELLPDGFILHRKERRYELRGLEKTPRALKATVRLTFGGKMHLDTIDLYCARARRQFVGDVTRLLDEVASAIEADVGQAMLEMLYSTGVRAAELLGLNMGDIDLGNATALVMGKGSKQRVVPFGRTAGRVLESYLKGVRPLLMRDAAEPAVWLNRSGRRVSYAMFRRRFEVQARQFEFPFAVTPHTFRRSCATELIRGGASLWHVKELLGHENLDTLQHYVRLTIADLKKTHARCHPRERDER